MRQQEIIQDETVQRYLHEVVGSEGVQVALNPVEGEMTDEQIAEEIDVDLKLVRRILIKLNQEDLADYRSVRDQESGWLTYYWWFEYENVYENLRDEMEQLLDLLKERAQMEQDTTFYWCDLCGIRYSFDEAYNHNFMCENCGSDLSEEEGEEYLSLLQRRIDEIEAELDKL